MEKKFTVVFKGGDGKKKQISTNDHEHAKGIMDATRGTLYGNHAYGRVKL